MRGDTYRWFVICDDFKSGPFHTKEGAERHRERVIDFGACKLAHHVGLCKPIGNDCWKEVQVDGTEAQLPARGTPSVR